MISPVKRAEGAYAMCEVRYLVWIWKRSFLGFYYRVPVVRTAHVDSATARDLGRMFTIEDVLKVPRLSAQ
jgi:hypothetical protein